MYVRDKYLAFKKGSLVQILATELFQTQLKAILQNVIENRSSHVMKFKTYLDAIIINIPTKISKYKHALEFEDERVKEIDFENYLIYILHDKTMDTFLILSIVEKN